MSHFAESVPVESWPIHGLSPPATFLTGRLWRLNSHDSALGNSKRQCPGETDVVLHSVLKTLLLLIACVAIVPSFADDKPASRKQPQTTSTEPVSEAAEKISALGFARAQHPELATLLDALRRSNQPAYQAALRDLSRDAERLNKLAERDADRHQLSLRIQPP